jgi:hypothetical protein
MLIQVVGGFFVINPDCNLNLIVLACRKCERNEGVFLTYKLVQGFKRGGKNLHPWSEYTS